MKDMRLLAILLLFATQAKAATEDLIRLTESIGARVEAVSSNGRSCSPGASSRDPTTLAESCYDEICSGNFGQSIVEVDKQMFDLVKNDRTYRPQIRRILNGVIAPRVRDIGRVNSRLEKMDRLPELDRKANELVLIGLLAGNAKMMVYGPSGALDVEASRRNLRGSPLAEYTISFYQRYPELQSLGQDKIFETVKTAESVAKSAEIAKVFHQQLERRYGAELLESAGLVGILGSFGDSNPAFKWKVNLDGVGDHSGELSKLGAYVALMQRLEKEPSLPSLAESPELQEAFTKRKPEALDFVKRAVANVKIGNEDLQLCEDVYIYIQHAYPTAEEIEKARKEISPKIDEMLSRTHGFLSRASADSLQKWGREFVRQKKLKFPPTRTQATQQLLQQLQKARARYQNNSQANTEQQATMIGYQQIGLFQPMSFFPEIARVCSDFYFRTISDAQEGDRIHVGWYGTRNALDGIVAHELGHAVLGLAFQGELSEHSKEKLDRALVCLKKNHNNLFSNIDRLDDSLQKRRPLSKGQSNPDYSVEDFADLFSAKVTSPSKGNFSCKMMKRSEVKVGIFNQDWFESHSSTFYRLLHTQQVMAGGLPDSCRKYIETSQLPIKFEDCFQ